MTFTSACRVEEGGIEVRVLWYGMGFRWLGGFSLDF